MQKQLQRTVFQKKCYALALNNREKSSWKSSFFRKVTDCEAVRKWPSSQLFLKYFKDKCKTASFIGHIFLS